MGFGGDREGKNAKNKKTKPLFEQGGFVFVSNLIDIVVGEELFPYLTASVSVGY